MWQQTSRGVCSLTGIRLRCLCGCSIYFNPIGGRPGIISPQGVDIDASEFPADWFEGLDDNMYKARRYIAERNKYKVAHFVMDSCGWHACWCLTSYLHRTSYTSCLYHLSKHTSCILCALCCQSCCLTAPVMAYSSPACKCRLCILFQCLSPTNELRCCLTQHTLHQPLHVHF